MSPSSSTGSSEAALRRPLLNSGPLAQFPAPPVQLHWHGAAFPVRLHSPAPAMTAGGQPQVMYFWEQKREVWEAQEDDQQFSPESERKETEAILDGQTSDLRTLRRSKYFSGH